MSSEKIGIIAMEIYFPRTFVEQVELAHHDGQDPNKYTQGLGQQQMGFACDREDVNSMCLTAVHRLMNRAKADLNITYADIGFMEVGTETLLDKSKSVKSVLMGLFQEHGNDSVEEFEIIENDKRGKNMLLLLPGVDTHHACYAGSASLMNCFTWLQSSLCDGRMALAVAGDSAVYAKGPARPTGGCGAVAILVGRDAPIRIESVRGVLSRNTFDFYKPDLASEYPVVDGALSLRLYQEALDVCYQRYCENFEKTFKKSFSLFEDADFYIFHSPLCRLVQKSVGRLLLRESHRGKAGDDFARLTAIDVLSSIGNRDIEKKLLSESFELFEKKTDKSLLLARRVGNMYTPGVFGGLASVICSLETAESMIDRRFVIFSYGSGLCAAMYSLKVEEQLSEVEMDRLKLIFGSFSSLKSRLDSRTKIQPEVFTQYLEDKCKNYNTAPVEPKHPLDLIGSDSYYLVGVDEKFRRFYHLKN